MCVRHVEVHRGFVEITTLVEESNVVLKAFHHVVCCDRFRLTCVI